MQAVLETIRTGTNPFTAEDHDNLCNISSGLLLHAYAIEEWHFMQFVNKRLMSQTVNFCDPLPKLKLKTVSALLKSRSVKVTGHEVVICADRHLFARLLVVAQTRALNLCDVLCFELGPGPWSIATMDGSLVKTPKSKLLDSLEKHVPLTENVPSDCAWMIDVMVLLQGITAVPNTFADLAYKVFEMVTASFLLGSVCIDFVIDRYPTISIKSCERSQ